MSTLLRPFTLVTASLLAFALPSCGHQSGGPESPRPIPTGGLRFVTVATGLDQPLFLTSPPHDPRLFVLERTGKIRLIKSGVVQPRPFLDLTPLITSAGGEQGLLGMAFAPDYASSGRFYVDYTNVSGDTRVVRYTVSSDPDSADPASAEVVLAVPQPYANHNGGMLAFGPDGMLYVGLGDGGSAGDPQGNGQNRGVLLGKILRLDVHGPGTYAIPPGNPFSSPDRPEIWSYGLRNPWRFSFDRQNGDLYVADVGQNQHEEVDVAGAASGAGRGLNFGWNIMEGLYCYSPSSGCDTAGLTLPVLDFSHRDGCSIIGGYVYRGTAAPALAGQYFYSDYCSKFLRSFRWSNGQATDQKDWGSLPDQPLSFGEDANGEVYVLLQGGTVIRLAS